jgi:hypothetical protein
MILRLDPRRPIVWRTPNSLQIGVDPALAVLFDVSVGESRVIDALVTGVTRSGLDMLAYRAAVSPAQVERLLLSLTAALLPSSPDADSRPTHSLAVRGHGIGADRIVGVLLEEGHQVTSALASEGVSFINRAGAGRGSVSGRGGGSGNGAGSGNGRTRRRVRPAAGAAAADPGEQPFAAILVSTHVVDPHEHLRWLRRDIRHLPVVFGEAGVTIGPLVIAGTTACLSCVEQQRTRVDSSRPAIMAQLWGTAAAAETTSWATEAAVEVVRMLRASIRNSKAAAFSVRLDTQTGERRVRVWRATDECGCRELSRLVPVSEPLSEPLYAAGFARPSRVPSLVASVAPSIVPSIGRGLSGSSGHEPRQENDSVSVLPAPLVPAAPTTTRARRVPA